MYIEDIIKLLKIEGLNTDDENFEVNDEQIYKSSWKKRYHTIELS